MEEVGVDTLQRTGAPHQSFDDVRQPGVARYSIQNDADLIEEGGGESVGQTPPQANADVGAAVLELSTGIHLLTVAPVLEADEEGLRAVASDAHVTWLKPELLDDGVLQVPSRRTGRDTHGLGDQCAALPVTHSHSTSKEVGMWR
jgi:hypothetical protein